MSRKNTCNNGEEGGEKMAVKKGPWSFEEDEKLAAYVSIYGEGRWDSLARTAGLRRTGKSCRLRWLNYLRPSIRRGNITPHEQLLIIQLHSYFGNRWSKIAEYLPGRTDNEIKNYWRTRVQKLAKQMKCEVHSKEFRESMHSLLLPGAHYYNSCSCSCSAGASEQDSSKGATDDAERQVVPLQSADGPNFTCDSLDTQAANCWSPVSWATDFMASGMELGPELLVQSASDSCDLIHDPCTSAHEDSWPYY